jgi:hypothetical protein
MGLLWTVGQTGLSDTNAHLCELFSRYFPDISENCQASDWIVTTAGYLFFLAVAITVLEIVWIIFKWPSRKPNVVGADASSPILSSQTAPSPTKNEGNDTVDLTILVEWRCSKLPEIFPPSRKMCTVGLWSDASTGIGSQEASGCPDQRLRNGLLRCKRKRIYATSQITGKSRFSM